MPAVSATRGVTTRWFLLGVVGCFIGGCAADRPKEVPKLALYKVGGDNRLVYIAEDNGTLYVTDQPSNSIMYSGRVVRGDRVVLDPDTDRLTVNEQIVRSKNIPHRTHKIFLLPGDVAPPTPVAETAGGRDIARPAGVPLTAALGGEGEKRIEYAAPTDGEVWVVNASAGTDKDAVVFNAPVLRGDRVAVDPEKDRITVGGRVYEKNLTERNRRIFFAPGAVRAVAVPPPPGTPAPAAGTRWDEMRADRLATAARPAEIPATAVLRGDRPGQQEFVADADGTVWIVNATTGQLAYSGRMIRNDSIRIDPTTNQILLNGRRADTQVLSGDRYRIYFRPGE